MIRTTTLELRSLEQGYHFTADMDGVKLELDTNNQQGMPSPVQVLMASVGGCTAMDVIGILRKMRQDVTGYRVVVQGDRRDEHPRVFTALEIVHEVRGRNLRPESIAEAIRLSDTKYCSVHAMLAPGVPMTSRFEIIEESAAHS